MNNHSIVNPLVALTLILTAVGSAFLPGSTANQVANAAQPLTLYANIETMGVVASASGVSLPPTAELLYRQLGETAWRAGHPLIRLDDGRLVGSLFGLSPATVYEVRVFAGPTEFAGMGLTQPEELAFTPTTILHVDDNAPAGGDGSAGAPFRTIQEAVNRAGPGTQVLVSDGVYREAVTFPASGNANQWIQVKAAGSAVILDGSLERTGNIWTSNKGHVWFMQVKSAVGYLARDRERFYKYDDLAGLLRGRGHGKVPIEEGWFFDGNTSRLYIRTKDDPSRNTWQISQFAHAFDVNGRDWIWIEGFEVQFYGRCGVCTLNVSHLVVRKNKIHNMMLGIYANWNGSESQGNDTRIEYNEISDPLIDEFPWESVKGSSMEGTAIIVRGHIGAIVRGNNIHNFFNGIYTGSSGDVQNPAVAFDADIYNNSFHNISDDALEPEGACVNHRFRNNTIDSSFVGVSLAPVTQGPTWVLRNVFSNFASTAIKWGLNSDGVVYLYHNSGWTTAGNVPAMNLITPIHNSVMRNNIFQSAGYAFSAAHTGSTGNDWDYDNWYTTVGAKFPRFKWEKRGYNTIAQLCEAASLECHGEEGLPGFTNPGSGDFTLLPSSWNIDRGVLLPGINDNFKGRAPDVGAYETAFDPPPLVLSSLRASADPTSAATVDFTVTFSEPVSGVDTDDFRAITGQGAAGASVTDVTPVSDAAYTVRLNTGSGNGTLRLDVFDDDSIVDSAGQPLAGTGNGSFITGEEYTIIKVKTVSISFKSNGVYDGWILESGENTNAGGTFDRNAMTFNIGDDQKDRQYKGILSFDTSSLPDNAVIASVQLKVKRQDVVGMDPLGTHGTLSAEIRKGPLGNTALEVADFSSVAGPARESFSSLTSSWYAVQLSDDNLTLVNKFGVTQFRLSFNSDDDDDQSADYLKFFSGNSTDANKPELVITYFVP